MSDDHNLDRLRECLDAALAYADHTSTCSTRSGYWASVGAGLPPARIKQACTCGWSDVLAGINACLASTDRRKVNA